MSFPDFTEMLNDRQHDYVTRSYHRVNLRTCLVLLLLTINDVINLEITSKPHNGVYVNDGNDQTTIRALTTDEKLSLEHNLMKRLGLSGKPQKSDGTVPLIKQSAQNFLLDAYKNKVDREIETKPSEFHLTANDMRTIDQSDVIMTFTAQQSDEKAEVILFDVDDVPSEGRLMSAELRLYMDPNAKDSKNRDAFTVSAYRVLRRKDGETVTVLVDSANTTAGNEGWITLNVTETLNHWMKHPGDNEGLRLSVSHVDPWSRETRPEEIGIVGFDGDAEHQPFMAGFFRSSQSNKARLLRATGESFQHQDYDKRNTKRDTTNLKSGSLCDVKKLYVSFKDLHWDDWVIAPEGIDVNYCSGPCNDLSDWTYHGSIQHFVNKVHPGIMPKPSCVPTKLSGIDALYYSSNRTVIMRKWENVSADKCGCV